MQTRFLRYWPALLIASLTACGGGGGGGGPADAGGSPDIMPAGDPAPPPLAIEAPATAYVNEGTTKAFEFTIDGGAEASPQTTLAGPDAALFRIDGAAVHFLQPPDFEAPQGSDNRYAIELSTTDGERSARTAVTIEVADLLEARVIDGPVADAIVFVDLNGDGLLNPDEPSALSDADGYVVVPPFTSREGTAPHLIAVDGIDTLTGERLLGFSMTAMVEEDTAGLFAVTPLTSLLARVQGDADANARLLTALGLTDGDGAEVLQRRDLWREAGEGDVEAMALLQAGQELATTLQSLSAVLLATDADPRVVASVTAALERELAMLIADGARLTDAAALARALAAVASAHDTIPLNDAQTRSVTGAVAEAVTTLGDPDLGPMGADAAAVLRVMQTTTRTRLRALRDGRLTEQAFRAQQRDALIAALAPTGGSDLDGDGLVDVIDPDNDGDGVVDGDDAFPDDGERTYEDDDPPDDAGEDGDNGDGGDDLPGDDPGADPGDDVDCRGPNPPQDCPVDTDGDGIVDELDPDDDNDGVADVDDAFPLDERDAIDTDGDGVGNNADGDDDGDTVADGDDANPLDPRVSAPARLTSAQAFKLLSMATFGATPALTEQLATLGPEAWVDAQLRMASAYDAPDDDWPTHLERTIEIAAAYDSKTDHFVVDPFDGTVAFNERKGNHLVRRFQMGAWHDNVFGTPNYPLLATDQLRQRTAYALGQLLVTSTGAPPLDAHGEALACYSDLLARHAFGNYRALLGDVARSPAMGIYLSHASNRKASLENATRPDENFARELIQLFTLGLYLLSDGGEIVTDGAGNPRPVYTQNDVEELAKIMTGWTLAGSRDFELRPSDGDYTRPMAFDPRWHEDEQDAYYGDQGDGFIQLLGTELPLNAADRIPDGDGKATWSGLDASLDVLFAHPNIAPYVSLHLIRHFVTANPSPDFVARISAVFRDDGNGVRGNLAAVVKAILLDREAYAQDAAIGGKVKEPLLAYSQLLRALDVRPMPDGAMTDRDDVPVRGVNFVHEGALPSVVGYAPMRAESVFGFFDPDHVPSDPTLGEAGLRAPEMGVMTDQFFANFNNFVGLIAARESVRFDQGLADRGTRSIHNDRAYEVSFMAPLAAMEMAMEGDANLDFSRLNEKDAEGREIYKEAAVGALVTWIDGALFGSAMPAVYRDALAQHLNDGMFTGESLEAGEEEKARERLLEARGLVRDALLMATSMPAFMVQQ